MASETLPMPLETAEGQLTVAEASFAARKRTVAGQARGPERGRGGRQAQRGNRTDAAEEKQTEQKWKRPANWIPQERMAALLIDPKAPAILSKEAFDASMEKYNADMKVLREKLSGDVSERKKYAPLYEQLRGHKEQKEEIKNRIESLEDSKAKKQDELKKMQNQTGSAKTSQEFEDQIKDMERIVDRGMATLKEEKDMLRAIASKKKLRPIWKEVTSLKAAVAEIEPRIKTLYEELRNLYDADKVIYAELDTANAGRPDLKELRAELDALRSEKDAAFKEHVNSRRARQNWIEAEKTKIHDELQQKWEAEREERRKAAHAEWEKRQAERAKQQVLYEKRQAERAARAKEDLEKRRAKKLEEASIPKHQYEIQQCQALHHYFGNLLVKPVESVSARAAEVILPSMEKEGAWLRKSVDTDFEQDSMFSGTKKSKKKSGRTQIPNQPPKLSLSIVQINTLTDLGVPVPISYETLPAVMTKLLERKGEYQEKQRKGILVYQEMLAKVAKGEESAEKQSGEDAASATNVDNGDAIGGGSAAMDEEELVTAKLATEHGVDGDHNKVLSGETG